MGKGTFIERPVGDALISFSDNVILTHKTSFSSKGMEMNISEEK